MSINAILRRRRAGLERSAKPRIAALGLAVALLGTLGGGLTPLRALAGSGPADIAAQRQATVYQAELDRRGAAFVQRQRILETVVKDAAVDLGSDEAAALDLAVASTNAMAAASAVLPQVSALAALEGSQLALADELTRAVDARSDRLEQTIRRVGLNPRLVVAKLDPEEAQGGPLDTLARPGETLDPRFARVGASLTRMSLLERGLNAIPSHLPASLEFVSSGFGFRSDPITGEPAMHAGLDFRGPIGTPIYAAAAGRVIFAGERSGYGNCLEIAHGNGMTTRYAHMSAFKAQVGQQVGAADAIGAIGNTGRSTGPHLHFEVRINDQAVNPRPFLDAGAAARS